MMKKDKMMKCNSKAWQFERVMSDKTVMQAKLKISDDWILKLKLKVTHQ